ncbi:MAG: acyl-CoA carboxylase subunit beta [Alphaproteobacteria bacterium]
MAWNDALEDLAQRRQAARAQGGAEAVAAHHAKGRLTVRERIDTLVDPGRFFEHGRIAGEASHDETGTLTGFTPANYVVGIGEVDGRPVVIGGEDFTLKGGSPNAAGLRKSVYSESLALQARLPLVRLLEGGGGSVRGSGGGKRPAGEPVFAAPRFASIAQVFQQVPVASAALGPVAGFPAARLAASHFSVMTESASIMVAGPAVVERALGDRLTKEDLGGAAVHARSGVVDAVAPDEPAALDLVRRFLSYLPSNVWEHPPVQETDDPTDRIDEALRAIVPEDRRRAFDIRKIARSIFDRDSLFEMGKAHGRGIVTMLARLGGRPVGVLGNDCRHFAGAMTADGAQKCRRFIDLCNQFSLPVISLVDEPGFMIGPEAERLATIRHGTAAVVATVGSRVPWASVVIRKAFGVAAAAHFGPQAYVLAWPSAEMGALPLEGGVAIAFGREIAAAEDPEARRQELEAALAQGLSPFPRAETFSLHEVIDPAETRPMLAAWLGWAARPTPRASGPYCPGPRP